MLTSPTNNLIVSIRPKYIRHISSIMKIAAITDESKINPADVVNIVGEVISTPKRIDDWKHQYIGFSTKDIQVGDAVIMSYRVVFDLLEAQGENAEPVYRNRFIYKAEEYFVADINNVFAVIRNNKVIMVNGYMMIEEYKEQTIILPQTYRRMRRSVSSTIINIDFPKTTRPKISAKRGDEVLFNPTTAQHYKVNDKPFVIIQQEQALAKITGK